MQRGALPQWRLARCFWPSSLATYWDITYTDGKRPENDPGCKVQAALKPTTGVRGGAPVMLPRKNEKDADTLDASAHR